MNNKFNGDLKVSENIKGINSSAAKTAKADMTADGITPLSEKQIFTDEELDELYSFDPDENWWNR